MKKEIVYKYANMLNITGVVVESKIVCIIVDNVSKKYLKTIERLYRILEEYDSLIEIRIRKKGKWSHIIRNRDGWLVVQRSHLGVIKGDLNKILKIFRRITQ